MTRLILDQHAALYEQTNRRPEARLYAAGDLVRFPEATGSIPAGAVLRVESVEAAENRIGLRRRSGEIVPWTPTAKVEVFAQAVGQVKVGMVLEWAVDREDIGVRRGDLARVSDVHPIQGIATRSNKHGEVRLEPEAGAWHYAITKAGVVGHLRDVGEHRLEPYRDLDPAPDLPTYKRPFDALARPYSLLTHGTPPTLDVFERGDVVYFAQSRAVPENHAFTIREIRNGRLRLVSGRELSGEGTPTADIWWRPNDREDVRLYKPARSIASQDLFVWRHTDQNLLVREGTYAEVVEVRARDIVVTGVTSTPEVLRVDNERWSPRWHRENGTWHLARSSGRSHGREQDHSTGVRLRRA